MVVPMPVAELAAPAPATASVPADSLAAILTAATGPEVILAGLADRLIWAGDASIYRLVPRLVAIPRHLSDVQAIIALAAKHQVPVCFRAGGTSLSGQAVTDGILMVISRHFRRVRVLDGGGRVCCQPGAVGAQVNAVLAPYGRRIGPDPASIQAAEIGGIVANNASGMCCGVAENSYRTIDRLDLILADGTRIDTGAFDADIQLERVRPGLISGLMQIRDRIRADTALCARIAKAFATKNTVGYSLNAFLDADTAAGILQRLVVGSEGTLAFIAEATFKTLPIPKCKSTAWLLFANAEDAGAAVAPLASAGAAAIEVLDSVALARVAHKLKSPLPPGTPAALLVEFQQAEESALAAQVATAATVLSRLPIIGKAAFTRDADIQASYWAIRKGLFPSVGAVRAAGTAVVIEDVTFPVADLARGMRALRDLFNAHGYADAVIFGHAKDGNLHFVLTQGFNTPFEIERYRAFMDDVVTMVVDKYDGALKAEHGTGRNMAPFVETEWGPDAYRIMQRLKTVTDPHNLLNPGVIVNPNPLAHVSDIKEMPVVEPEVDKCIECGFCEHSCPSRDITLTPRQRIVVRREMQRLKDSNAPSADYAALERDFPYMALDTCATDGLCATDCPVSIDTGKLTKRFRSIRHSRLATKIAETAARHFAVAEWGARFALRAGHLIESSFGPNAMSAITRQLDRISSRLLDASFWQWTYPMPKPRRGRLPTTPRLGASAVYYPACISRIMGALPGEPDETTNMQALLNIAARSGVKLHVPSDVTGHCCGVPFSSKGFDAGNSEAVNHTIESFYRWSDSGHLPIVIDTSPCSYGLKTCRPQLTPDNQQKFDKLRILDSVEFAKSAILPKLHIVRKMPSVALHPVCSASKMGISAKLVSIAHACSEEVVVPQEAGCCAFAGDRGFLHPELTASATQSEATELESQRHTGYFSSSRTCEIGMTRATGQLYRSYLHMLDHASRP